MKRSTLPDGSESGNEQALLEHEQFRLLAEHLASVVFVVLDVDLTRVVYASPSLTTLLQREAVREGDARTGLLGVMHPEDRERGRRESERCREGPREFDVRLYDASGQLRWLRCRAFPIRDASGAVRRLGFVLEDRTTQRQAEALLDDLHRHAVGFARAAGDPLGILRRALDARTRVSTGAADRRRAPLPVTTARDGFAQQSALLTRRQREVMEFLVDGKSTKRVAEALGLSRKTVESHRAQVLRKLNLENVAELVRAALLARARARR